MTRSVEWTREALDDLKSQIAFIAAENPVAARSVADRLFETCANLGVLATGRPGRVRGTYEKPVPRLPYVVAYAVTLRESGECISILRIIHGARNWPDESWPD